MILGMTKAIYGIKKTFTEMVDLHEKEIANHQNLIDGFRKRALKTKDYEERLICLMEAHRNKEHQRGHKTIADIYRYLEETK